MIISHKYRFIFIKTAKTAGTSIEVFLSRHCADGDIFTPITPAVPTHEPRNYQLVQGHDPVQKLNHIPAYALRERLSPEIWSSYTKFCVERNPWDKTLSHFSMMRLRYDPPLTFEQYLAHCDLPFNFPRYCDAQGNILVDYILKYENLAEQLALLFGKLGIPFDGDLGVRAKSEYRTDRRHYREIYTPEQASYVGESFAAEITMHNYQY